MSFYPVPVNADVGQVEVIMLPEVDQAVSPAGVKGIGELGNVGTNCRNCRVTKLLAPPLLVPS